ncbi:M48 family metallopeptidase [Chitinispirillales bacterium ANBcel5]|uniref:M48 family metallopeptidase n=1 Tax=Cellulosispirillum alkaliphilum TaxID=3039283 RepID=UPI002A586E26|nr:M48 family metallopeptidase [Chitinispirillales bacterium ANBcel5]
MTQRASKELLLLGLLIVITACVAFFSQQYIKNRSSLQLGLNQMDQFSIDMEKKFSKQVKNIIIKDAALVNSPEISHLIDSITNRFEHSIEDIPYPIEVLVVNSSTVNAVTFPGGLIVIYVPLIRLCDSPEQLASVIAHEVAHVVNRDPLKRMVRQFGVSTVLSIMGGGSSTHLQSVIKNLIDVTYTREQEERADSTAFFFLAEAGICPSHFSDFMNKLDEETSEGDSPLRYFSTHPPVRSRIQNANSAALKYDVDAIPLDFNWDELLKGLPSIFD